MGSRLAVRARRSTAALLSVLVLAGCTTHPATTSASPSTTVTSSAGSPSSSASVSPSATATAAPPSSTPVGADGSATLASGGYGVQLGSGAASGGELTMAAAAVSSVPGAYSAPLVKPLGPAMNLELDGGALQGPATVTFPVPAGLPDSTPLVVVWQDGSGGWQWLQPTRSGDVVTARTSRLSWGFLAMVDVTSFAAQELTAFKTYVGGRAGAKPPTCQGEAQARADGTQLIVGKGTPVKWCFGLENGQRVLKITNNALTFQQVTYPSSWTLAPGQPPTLSVADLASAVGIKVTPPLGASQLILGGGATLTFLVPPSSGGRANVTMSEVSLAASAILFGVREFGEIVTEAQSPYAGAAKSLLSHPAAALGLTSGSPAKVLGVCADALGAPVAVYDSARARGVLYASFECVPGLMAKQLQGVKVADGTAGLPLLITAATQSLTAVDLRVSGDRKSWLDVVPSAYGGLDVGSIYVVPGGLLSQTLSFGGGWAGITPGEDIGQAAAGLGTVTAGSCGGGFGPPQIVAPVPFPYIVGSGDGGTVGSTVSFIDVQQPGVVGPDNVQVGDLVSLHRGLTSSSRLVKHVYAKGFNDAWILKADNGWYFWLRSYPGTGRVVSFGLASTYAIAYSRAGTQGGC